LIEDGPAKPAAQANGTLSPRFPMVIHLASPVARHGDVSKTASANQRRDDLCACRTRRVYSETMSGMERFRALFVEIQQRVKY
jgi:hypothetical protein